MIDGVDDLDDLPDTGPVRQPTFYPEYPVSSLKQAGYNPRRLDDESFTRLKASLTRYGPVKPVIANGDGTLVAGNQRHRTATALGWETIPAVILHKTVSPNHEIYLNLAHNAVEYAGGKASVPPSDTLGWKYVPWEHVTGVEYERLTPVTTTGKLIARYGNYGSVVADATTGEVVANIDYAAAASRCHVPVLVNYVTAEHATELADILTQEFGVYDQTPVAEQWKQWAIQPTRASTRPDAKRKFRKSPVYETHVIPRLSRHTRAVDLGAGKLTYPERLQKLGYHVLPYEPYMTRGEEGNRTLNIRKAVEQQHAIRNDIEHNGLYDIVILDNVINAATNDNWLTWITAAANALLHPEGTLCWGVPNGTLQRDLAKSATGARSATSTRTSVFWTPDDYLIALRWGQFTVMKSHNTHTIAEWLHRYFDEVNVTTSYRHSNINGTARKPKQLTPNELHEALTNELNPPYPNGYRHNRHEPLLNTITRAYNNHQRPNPTNPPTK